MGAGYVLVVCGKRELAAEIASMLLGDGFVKSDCCLSANEARRKLDITDPDLIVINSPLPDDNGVYLVADIADKTEAGIIVLAKHEMLSEMQYQLEKAGALILPKPISRTVLKQTARFALNSRKSIKGLRSERDDLQKRMDERKTVEKAKWYLVEKLNMTEPQAHRYIQKQAMDRRMTQMKVAEEIIKNYE